MKSKKTIKAWAIDLLNRHIAALAPFKVKK